MTIQNLVHVNFDLLSVAISIASIVLLGVLIYYNNPRSVTNDSFFIFALLTAVWGISNYVEYRMPTALATLWALRLHLFISTFHAFYFFRLAYVFPRQEITFPRWYRTILIPIVGATAILTLTPFVFSSIGSLAPAGEVTRATPAPGIALFMIVAFGLLISALVLQLKKVIRSSGIERQQGMLLLIGMALTACLLLVFNVILPNVFSNRSFIPLAALFILPFVTLTSYAIYRHHLFNLRVAATAFLGFMVTVFTFINVVYSISVSEIIINVTAFFIVLLGSIQIVRSTVNLQIAEEELEFANTQQESLLHFISHEIKGYLAKSEAGFAAIIEGDYGETTPELKGMATAALGEVRKGVTTVMDILNASNLKKGTVSFVKKPFDLGKAVEKIVTDLQATAEEKGLKLELHLPPEQVMVTGDDHKIEKHVIRNIIDNSIKYTQHGNVSVTISKNGTMARMLVEDTGVGITAEDMSRLFTEGGRGKESIKVNVHSTGYGLYIAKQIVEAHGGHIRAESEGAGKGSCFVVELPTL